MTIDFFPGKLNLGVENFKTSLYTRQCRLFPSEITLGQIKDARPPFPTVESFIFPPTVFQQDQVLISMQHVHSMLNNTPLETDISLWENHPMSLVNEMEFNVVESMYLEGWDETEASQTRVSTTAGSSINTRVSSTGSTAAAINSFTSPRRRRVMRPSQTIEKRPSIVPRAPSFIPQHRSASVAHSIAKSRVFAQETSGSSGLKANIAAKVKILAAFYRNKQPTGRIVSTNQRQTTPRTVPVQMAEASRPIHPVREKERSKAVELTSTGSTGSTGRKISSNNTIATHRRLSQSVIPLRSDLQERLEHVLCRLKVSSLVKLDLVMKYTSPSHAMQLTRALDVWEAASDLVLKREEMLRKIRHFEIKASDPRRHFHSISTERLVEERNRRVLNKKFDAISQQCHEKLILLLNSFQDQLIYQDFNYLDKMAKDYVATLHEIEQLRRVKLDHLQ